MEDFEFEGRTVLSSRLGYRITAAFADRFLGRIFELPGAVFPEELLRPEKQRLALFVSGVEAIAAAQRTVARILRGRRRGAGVPADKGDSAHHGLRGL